MGNKITIYLDLDETLIHSVCGLGHGTDLNFQLDGYTYSTYLRESAGELITLAKKYGNIAILTNSVQDYARKIIFHFFGEDFTNETIITRHQYSESRTAGYGGMREVASCTISQPDSILIDNLYADDPGARNKMEYLGIKPERFINVSSFYGPDSGTFLDLALVEVKLKTLTGN